MVGRAVGGDASDSDDDSCRCCFCFGTEHPEDFIHPCLCKGTLANVHEACLNEWRASAAESTRCPTCKYPFKMQKAGVSRWAVAFTAEAVRWLVLLGVGLWAGNVNSKASRFVKQLVYRYVPPTLFRRLDSFPEFAILLAAAHTAVGVVCEELFIAAVSTVNRDYPPSAVLFSSPVSFLSERISGELKRVWCSETLYSAFNADVCSAVLMLDRLKALCVGVEVLTAVIPESWDRIKSHAYSKCRAGRHAGELRSEACGSAAHLQRSPVLAVNVRLQQVPRAQQNSSGGRAGELSSEARPPPAKPDAKRREFSCYCFHGGKPNCHIVLFSCGWHRASQTCISMMILWRRRERAEIRGMPGICTLGRPRL
ncbi:hypothetical protein DIPPA_33718 [Diplonema papillatum]|nr:hypothetical protein DIPPA_33718 [Diplonema papillatum]